jgi:KDO2-lipid IV(A) lauroyltransferase
VGDLRRRATFLTYRYLGEAMARVPEPVAEAAAALSGEVMARRDSPARDMARRHLRHVLLDRAPGLEIDEALLERWVRRSFRSYARYWMEGARLPSVPHDEVDQRMLIESGLEHLAAGMAVGRGVIMALPHVGCWEWGGAWLDHIGYHMTSVAERIEPPELNQYFVDQRETMGLSVIPLDKDAGSAVLRTLRAGKLVGLLCDRDLAGDGVPVEFFGECTTFPSGPATLAMRAGATLITGCVYAYPRGQHAAVLSAPLDLSRQGSLRQDVARVTQEIARHFEGYIRQAPEQWHLFQPNWPSDLDEIDCGRPPVGDRIEPARSSRTAVRGDRDRPPEEG